MVTRTISADDLATTGGYLTWKTSHRSHHLELGDFSLIGRESDCHLLLTDPYVSLKHARIELRGKNFIIRDLRSRNGTFLNGGRIYEAQLKDGDCLRIGESDLSFYLKDSEIQSKANTLSSRSPIWMSQLQKLPNMALSDFPVLITGPSGSGKDVVAQNIHRLSKRQTGPLVSVNCSALSEALVESELFGHLKGSFTGATTDRKGAFEAARNGTLFLDEIGDLPLSLQPKLLRALENNQIRPVGSDRDVETNVRIVAATHHDLRQLVADGKFRADLYFRLHVVHIQAPALNERMEDFVDLVYHFAKTFRVRFSVSGIQRLKDHTWPGNIRELRNVVARAKAHYGRIEVGPEEVALLIDEPMPMGGHRFSAGQNAKAASLVKSFEKEMIKERLVVNRGNQRLTAADLGMPKSTLHDRIRAYAIDIRELLRPAHNPLAGESLKVLE